jgi:hypothetical protein
MRRKKVKIARRPGATQHSEQPNNCVSQLPESLAPELLSYLHRAPGGGLVSGWRWLGCYSFLAPHPESRYARIILIQQQLASRSDAYAHSDRGVIYWLRRTRRGDNFSPCAWRSLLLKVSRQQHKGFTHSILHLIAQDPKEGEAPLFTNRSRTSHLDCSPIRVLVSSNSSILPHLLSAPL